MQNQINKEIQTHYSRPDLGTIILDALGKAGKDLNCLTLEDLAPIDEFHIRGRSSTLELAHAAGLDENMRVLDVGSGVGGTARRLAKEFGCRVTGIDLTEEYCRAAAMLSEKIGLTDLVDYRQGDAINLPFDQGTFDAVWTEHVAMNIPDKSRLYREMYRVLKPGGILAINDVLAGPSGPVLFPVPWARTADTSYLIEPGALSSFLKATGFTIIDWSDTTDAALRWFESLAEKIRKEGFPSLGLQVLMGADFLAMAQNQVRNLQDGRIVLGQVVARK